MNYTNADKIKTVLDTYGYDLNAICAILANMYAESNLYPDNLQNTYNKSFGETDASYTKKVNNGTISKNQFAHDKAGYGLCQWTYHTRKNALYEYATNHGKTIDDMSTQVAFMVEELCNDFKSVENNLRNSNIGIDYKTELFMSKFEAPADCTPQAIAKRCTYAHKYHDYFKSNTKRKKNGIITIDSVTYRYTLEEV